MYIFESSVNERLVLRLVMGLFWPLAILGIWQGLTNHSIVPTKSLGHYFKVLAWDFFGRVRAFSLFNSASAFGHFLAWVAAIWVAAISQWRKINKLLAAAGLVTTLVVTYMTLTRATYVEVLLALTTATLIAFLKWPNRRLSLLWVVYMALGFFVAFGAPEIIAGLRGIGHISSDESLIMRYHEWAHYGGLLLSHGIVNVLFGTGLMQGARFGINKDIVIDNTWLALLFHFGLVGFVVILIVIWQIWKNLLRGLQSHPHSILTISVISACSTLPFTSVFGITTLDYYLLFILWLLSRKT